MAWPRLARCRTTVTDGWSAGAWTGSPTDFERELRAGNVTAASGAGADFSTVVISASGNRELQTHIDLLVTRTPLRVLALTADSDVWTIWLTGYRDVLSLLERGQRRQALDRYRQIYVEQRALLETLLLGQEHGDPG